VALIQSLHCLLFVVGELGFDVMMIREREIYLSKLAEQAERYDDMVKHVNAMCTFPDEPSLEERNLLSVAYKNAVGNRRAAIRILERIAAEEVMKCNNERANHTTEYRMQVQFELQSICEAALTLLEQNLIPKATSGESKVFYIKMKSDYHLYLGDVLTGEAKATASEAARMGYVDASSAAASELAPTHPIRLGLSLSWAVWNYEVLGLKDEAVSLARSALDAAIEDLDNVSEDSYKDSTLIMQLLRDNLNKWTTAQDCESDPPLTAPLGIAPVEAKL